MFDLLRARYGEKRTVYEYTAAEVLGVLRVHTDVDRWSAHWQHIHAKLSMPSR